MDGINYENWEWINKAKAIFKAESKWTFKYNYFRTSQLLQTLRDTRMSFYSLTNESQLPQLSNELISCRTLSFYEIPSCIKIEEFEYYKEIENDFLVEGVFRGMLVTMISVIDTEKEFNNFIESCREFYIDINSYKNKIKYSTISNLIIEDFSPFISYLSESFRGKYPRRGYIPDLRILSEKLNIEIFLKNQNFYKLIHFHRLNYFMKLFIFKKEEGKSWILIPKKSSYPDLKWQPDAFSENLIKNNTNQLSQEKHKKTKSVPNSSHQSCLTF